MTQYLSVDAAVSTSLLGYAMAAGYGWFIAQVIDERRHADGPS